MGGFNRSDYRAAQTKRKVVYGSARTGVYLIVSMKESRSMFHFKCDTTVAGRLLVQVRHKCMGARTRATIGPFSPYAMNALCLRWCGLTQICWLCFYLTALLVITIQDGCKVPDIYVQY